MVRSHPIFVLALVVLPYALHAEDAPAGCLAADGTAAPCAASQGQIVFIDPKTGQVLSGEAAAEAAASEENSAFIDAVSDQVRESFRSDDLVERRTETGAIVVDLNGRFQSPLVAQVGSDGTIVVDHVGGIFPAID